MVLEIILFLLYLCPLLIIYGVYCFFSSIYKELNESSKNVENKEISENNEE